ncbi:MAG: tail fiber domain-containing protein, partial [Alphaproteobacteria bacterium]|nr:tail fiber domain-containing protein [Alphaproteobacteria bacterium]
GLLVQNNGTDAVNFGFNNSTNEAYIWAYGSSTLKFGTNAIKRMQLLNNGTLDLLTNNLITTGTINAQTGTLIANNLAAYNSGVIVCGHALSVQDTGTYKPYNGSYGYLNSSGTVGTSTGQNPYSINCNNRVKASEFNAVSSIKTKNIESSGEHIEEEALKIFSNIPFFKYSYKDKIKNGQGVTFGIVAEPLKEILPDYVLEDKSFVPNILQSCLIKPITECSYELVFKEKLTNIEGSKLQLILLNKSVEVEILKTTPKRLIISCSEKLPNNGFAYGTFETCPSVTKNKLFELSMVVLKNTLKRVDILK